MSWETARRIWRQRRSSITSDTPADLDGGGTVGACLTGARASSVCVASGKGGTGKSVFSASLATCIMPRGRTLICDADMGIGNAHILQGISPVASFVELVAGSATATEILSHCSESLDLIAAGSGVSNMAELSSAELHKIALAIEELESDYAHLLVDSAAGISNQTLAFAAAADLVVIVTTPDVTAMTDAYAFIKVLLRGTPECQPLLVVNRAHSFDEAASVVHRIEGVCQRFLHRTPRWIGWVPEDDAVQSAVNARAPVVSHEPDSPAALALAHLALQVLEEMSRLPKRGLGRQLASRISYSPKLA
ncbi:MAG TPA: MinD/ParA family protein [Planctomycetes bacterium]|nr:MinD/ParA family protein [Planctomycetota bacterium]HIL52323.1 MinD/ParA family protein [Planctomycetota bacterium]